MGRLRKEKNEKLERKLLELLEKNFYDLEEMKKKLGEEKKKRGRKKVFVNNRPEILRVEDILRELKKEKYNITPKGLYMKLISYRNKGLIEVERLPKDRRAKIYYCHRIPLLLNRVIIPLLQERRFTNESLSHASILINTKSYTYAIGHRVMLVEDGFDLTSKLDWEKIPRDILGNILSNVKHIMDREIRLHTKPQDYEGLSVEKKIDKFKENMKGNIFAFIYILDGSDFKVFERSERDNVSKRIPENSEGI